MILNKQPSSLDLPTPETPIDLGLRSFTLLSREEPAALQGFVLVSPGAWIAFSGG
jgi:hypothetical protein